MVEKREKERTGDPLMFGVGSIFLIGLSFFMLYRPNYLASLSVSTGTPFDGIWDGLLQPNAGFVWSIEVGIVIGIIGILLLVISLFRQG